MSNQPTSSAALGLAALALCGGRAGAQVTFEPPVAYGTGSDPEAVVAADFDGDGDLELLSTIHSPARLSLLDNLGNGTFAAPVYTTLTSGVDPAGLVARDFDLDGDVDVLVSYRETNAVKFLANRGDASFVGGDFVIVGDAPNQITAFDVDGDGDEDAAVVNTGDGTVSILRNLGMGDFQLADTVAVGTSPRGLAFGQVIGDSRRDLAVAVHGLRRVSLLRNNGGGDFSLAMNLPVGQSERPEGVGIADFDKNGLMDVVASISDTTTNDFGLWAQTAPGAFDVLQYFDTGGVHPVEILVHDLDLDTWTDVVTVNSASNTVSVLRNAGGSFGVAQVYPLLGPQSDFITCGDLDRNHYVDLVCTNDGGNSVSVLLSGLGNPRTYCSSSRNSTGLSAYMGWDGNLSLSDNDFTLYAAIVPNGSNGLFFYGSVPQDVPYFGGHLCILPPLVRLGPPVTSAWNQFWRDLDFTAAPLAYGAGAVTAGSAWNFQLWYRDPAAGGSGTNFSDGLRVVFEP
jgi:hypothetical protein